MAQHPVLAQMSSTRLLLAVGLFLTAFCCLAAAVALARRDRRREVTASEPLALGPGPSTSSTERGDSSGRLAAVGGLQGDLTDDDAAGSTDPGEPTDPSLGRGCADGLADGEREGEGSREEPSPEDPSPEDPSREGRDAASTTPRTSAKPSRAAGTYRSPRRSPERVLEYDWDENWDDGWEDEEWFGTDRPAAKPPSTLAPSAVDEKEPTGEAAVTAAVEDSHLTAESAVGQGTVRAHSETDAMLADATGPSGLRDGEAATIAVVTDEAADETESAESIGASSVQLSGPVPAQASQDEPTTERGGAATATGAIRDMADDRTARARRRLWCRLTGKARIEERGSGVRAPEDAVAALPALDHRKFDLPEPLPSRR